MTLVQLRHLVFLAATGSFSRCAEAVHLTQPALSRSIKALEDELGQKLFDRIGRRAELTPYGREVLQRARRLIDDAESLKESAQRMAQGLQGRLRMGLGSGPGAILSASMLRHVALHHPAAQVEVARGGTALLIAALRERRLDALVVDARSLQPAADLQVQALAELPGAFLCRAGHPLLRRRSPLRFEDLRAYPIASTPLSEEIERVLVERYGPAALLDACVSLRCDDLAVLSEVVQSSDAVLLAVRSSAPRLRELTLRPALNATARFALVTLAGRSEPPLLPLLLPPMRQWLAAGLK